MVNKVVISSISTDIVSDKKQKAQQEAYLLFPRAPMLNNWGGGNKEWENFNILWMLMGNNNSNEKERT